MSKSVAQQRSQMTQYTMMNAQLTTIEMQMTAGQMNQNIVGALAGTNQVMQNTNADMDVAQIRDVMKEFGKQMGKQEMNNEMVADAFEMADEPYKEEAMRTIASLGGQVVATFENEPANAHIFADAFPAATHLLVGNTHRPDAPEPRPELRHIDDFRM